MIEENTNNIKNKIEKIISIIFYIFGIVLSLLGLFGGLLSLGFEGCGKFEVVLIIPSIIILIIVLLDLLSVLRVIKVGLSYSIISCLSKIGIIIFFLQKSFHEYKYQMRCGPSYYTFYLIISVLILIITIPSIINLFEFISLRKRQR